MPATSQSNDPYRAFRHRNYRLFMTGRLIGSIGGQTSGVAIGWEIYERTHSATALGLLGLTYAFPLILLIFPAGHVADYFNRKRVTLWTMALMVTGMFVIALASYFSGAIPHWSAANAYNAALLRIATAFGEKNVVFTEPVVPVLFLLYTIQGTAQAMFNPARQAMLPEMLPIGISAMPLHGRAAQSN